MRNPDEMTQDDCCSLCQTGIGQGEKYVTIELSEETSSPGCVETFEVHALLATVCGKCADQYMVWL